jgi:hypothetical protein
VIFAAQGFLLFKSSNKEDSDSADSGAEGKRFCKDCMGRAEGSTPLPSNPQRYPAAFLVAGTRLAEQMHDCSVIRTVGTGNSCGPEAKHWQSVNARA